MTESTKVISVRIPVELYDKIVEELAEGNQTMSEWIFMRISAYQRLLDKKSEFEEFLDELEAVLDEGNTIEGLPVVEYLRSFFNDVL